MSHGRTYASSGEGVVAALAGLARREARGEAPGHAGGHPQAPGGAVDVSRERVLAGFRRRRAAPRTAALRLVAAALLGVAVLGLVTVLAMRAPLRFTIDGAPGVAGAYVHAPPKLAEGAGATVRFTDGSEITFAAGASGRLVEVGARGARVLLETGRASFAIAHRSGARWSVEAGPYVIAVVGTAFEATWSPEAQALEVRLHAGEVAVSGPLAPAGVHLRAGQRLTARVAEGEMRIGISSPSVEAITMGEPPMPPAQPVTTGATTVTMGEPTLPPASLAKQVATPPSAAAPPADDGAAARRPAATVAPSAAPSSGAPLGWSRRVALGDFRGVVNDAEGRGVDTVLRKVPLADLAALADAARYAGRADLARRALLAERARFARSAEARAAAFLLGRLADDAGHDGGDPHTPGPAGGSPAAAVQWYDDYLREAPDGAFAPEALGRKLAALRRAGDPAARAVAAEYLRRHPEGPYAASARELLVAP